MIIITTKEKTVFANEEHVKFLFHDKEKGIVTINSHNGVVTVEDVVEVRFLDRQNTDYLDKGNALLKAAETVEYARRKLDWFRRREKCYRDIVECYRGAMLTMHFDAENRNHDEETLRAAIMKTVKDAIRGAESLRKQYKEEEAQKFPNGEGFFRPIE